MNFLFLRSTGYLLEVGFFVLARRSGDCSSDGRSELADECVVIGCRDTPDLGEIHHEDSSVPLWSPSQCHCLNGFLL